MTCDDFSAHNGGAVAFKASSGTNGAAPGNVSFNCMDLIGPGMNHSYNNNQAVVSIDYGGASDIQFTNCAIHGSPNPVWIAQSYRIVFDHCKIYEADCLNTETIHPNVLDIFGSSVVMRYCELWSWSVEGLQLWGSDVEGAPGCDVLVYGCVFRDTALNIVSGGSGVGRAFIASPNWPPLHRIRAYNNTFSDMVMAVGLYYSDNRYASNCDIKNNIYWNCNWQSDTAPADRDYDFGSGSGVLGAHSISSGSSPFIDYSGKDYNIITNIAANLPRNKGVALDAIAGETLNLDANGNTRGADGTWDIGAYEAGGTNAPAEPPTDPICTVSASSITFPTIWIGSNSTATITVSNTGTNTLTGTNTTTEPFTIVSGSTYSLTNGQSQVVTLRFTPADLGETSSTLSFVDNGGGASVSVAGTGVNLLGLSFSATNGQITSPFEVSGQAISQPSETTIGNGGTATYWFNVTNAGNYRLLCNLAATDPSYNSVWLNVDSSPTNDAQIFDMPIVADYSSNVPVVWRGGDGSTFTYETATISPKTWTNLTAGVHKLYVIGREANASLSNFTFVATSTNSVIQGSANPQLLMLLRGL